MLWDLAIIDMPLRVLKEKVLLYHHICTLPKTSLAFQMMETQERLHLPSLRQEVLPFLAKFEISDITQFSKEKWRTLVRRNIKILNRDHLLDQLKKYKKVDFFTLASEEFEIKAYFN